ncbi:MAG TPA: cytochrome c oxidase assembly protein [Mycobacteriales bacterium]|nr:cytochrome c oxidase assembly protein [Mycobacteriales bacterium]
MLSPSLTAVLFTHGDEVAPFNSHTAFTEWEFAPVVSTGLAVAVLLYLYGMWRVRRDHPARPWPWLRAGSFLAGLVVVAIATQSSVGAYDDALFSVHMVQHLLLIMVAPPFLIAGRPIMLLLHASGNPLHTWTKTFIRSRFVSALTCPPVTAVIYAAVIVGTHLTGFMNVTLRHENIHQLEHAIYLVAGYLYFLPLLGSEPIRWKMSFPTRFLMLAMSMPVDTFVGVVLMQANHELFSAYRDEPRNWGPSLVSDLHAGGAIMWVGGDAIMFVLVLCVFVVFLRDKRAHGSMGTWLEGARSQAFYSQVGEDADVVAGENASRRGATVDDDEHLAAYNAHLARLAGRSAANDKRKA